ncbi:MAG: hypothetical protein K2Q18_18390, partial [Bdellovibrionales bacterium]|nr:hypothetical protein [Bdellovibrionales bacterium]
ELYLNKILSYEVARDAASSPSNFERNLEFGQNAKPKPRIVVKNKDEKSGVHAIQEEEETEDVGPPASLGSDLVLEEKKKA